MKRLLKVSCDIVISSVTPIVLWFCLSLIIDKRLINVFAITYPLQFISGAILSVFSVGANICKEKEKNKYIVFTGIVVGILSAIIIFGIFIFNIDLYLIFMSVDVDTYKLFTIFSIIILFLYLILAFIVNKLHFENNNTLANYYSFTFNGIYAIVLIFTAMIFNENEIMIAILTTVSLIVYIVFILYREIALQLKDLKKSEIKLNLFSLLKYDSVDLITYISRFLLYLFGFSNTFQFGQEYVTALTFCALLTDTQWDAICSISIVAKIDIAKDKFIYKEHMKNAYKLLLLLFLSIAVMFICLNRYYELNYKIVSIILMLDLVNFALYPVYAIKTYVIQLTKSAQVATINKFISYAFRLACSFLPIPLCTCIGQFTTGVYQYVSFGLISKKYSSSNKSCKDKI